MRAARERAGLTQRDLAFRGCSPGYVSRIEAGARIPSLDVLRELARRLGVSEESLLAAPEGSDLASTLRDAEIALRLDDIGEAGRLYGTLADAADAETQAQALEGLGQIALRSGKPHDAIELLERALAIAGSEASDRPGLALALARAYGTIGELAPAIALLEQCVERFAGENDVGAYVRFAAVLGCALTDNGDFARAEQVVAKALATGRKAKDPQTRARLYWSQSRLLVEQGRSGAAEHYARKTLEILRTTEDTYAIGLAHEVLAHICIELDRGEEAIDLLREGWPLIAATATPIELAHYRIEEARALAVVGEKEKAAALAMEVTAQLGDAQPTDAGRAYLLLGEVFEDLDEKARAMEVYELAVELHEGQRPGRYLVAAYKRLSALLKAEGRPGEALDLL